MKFKKTYGFLALITLQACSAEPFSPIINPESHKLENLYSAKLNESAIEIAVISTGCTKLTDFVIESRQNDNICEIRIYRTRPDLCKRLPAKETLQIPWDKMASCQQSEVKIINNVINGNADKLTIDK